MKKIIYGVIPVVIFCIIFVNAFFGHLIFISETEQVANKYSVYAHLQPEWNSDSKNILFEVTNSWYKLDRDDSANYVLNADAKEYNTNQLQSVDGKSYVELKHEFSDCQEEWQPMLYRKVVDTVRHEIEYVQGNQLNTNPDISVYPDIENQNYDNSQQQSKIKNGFVQFIPICTSNDSTSYDYSIKIDNDDVGFDVYFVKSSQEHDDFFIDTQNFDYYTGESCFAQNRQSYSGTCNNVSKYGGLLIVVPDELKPWITKFTINLYEVDADT